MKKLTDKQYQALENLKELIENTKDKIDSLTEEIADDKFAMEDAQDDATNASENIRCESMDFSNGREPDTSYLHNIIDEIENAYSDYQSAEQALKDNTQYLANQKIKLKLLKEQLKKMKGKLYGKK